MRYRIALLSILLSAPITLWAQSAPQSVTFFIDPVKDVSTRTSIETTLHTSSSQSAFYVDKGFYDSLTQEKKNAFDSSVLALNRQFDTVIYPRLRETLGTEWIPGIDNSSRITVLIHPMKNGIGGYVREHDEYLKTGFLDSNEQEMVYFNANVVSDALAPSYLAHEFQHLIIFNQKERLKGTREETWLNEAFSEYAPTLAGYNAIWNGSYLQKRVRDFLNFPPDSLLRWNNESADYASATLFIHYVAEHYGMDVLRGILTSEEKGVAAFNQSLSSQGKTFSSLFTDWIIANYINNITLEAGDLYAYKNPVLFYGNFHVSPRATFNLASGQSAASTFSVQDWQADYYKFQPAVLGPSVTPILRLEFRNESQDAQFILPYIITDFSGKSRVRFLNIPGGVGTVYISDFGTNVASVVLVVSSQTAQTAEAVSAGFKSFSLHASLVSSQSSPSVISYADGSLVRAAGDSKVYVIKKGLIRWLRSPTIFNGYGHLRWDKIVQVPVSVLGEYKESNLIRLKGDYKIYEVDATGQRHWLNMTALQFEGRGYKWEEVYEVNENEFQFFSAGSDIR